MPGTSELAPLYAGLTALLNVAMADTVGYRNPILYQLGILARAGEGSMIFPDLADGGSNADSGAPGYIAVPGGDAGTGWGSVHGVALLECH